uniref:GOLD domain-containing protein n=2 Tax=Spongospora subterranea TaxID=70186 RepID=A0A0H5RJZ0_9EUKA|eukprot:CRZ09039.1 hypothetical protein [Spongospora subterranea]
MLEVIRACWALTFLSFFVAVSGTGGGFHTWTLVVEPKSEDCVYEHYEAGHDFEMKYEVNRGGLLDVRVVINGPQNTLYDKMEFFNRADAANNDKLGLVKIKIPVSGVHSICIDNIMSRYTPKTYTLSIKGESNIKSTLENAKLEHLGPVVDSVIKVSEDMDGIVRQQHALRVREQIHRDTQENTNYRVQLLAIIEALSFVSLNVLQIYFIRSWFADAGTRRRV